MNFSIDESDTKIPFRSHMVWFTYPNGGSEFVKKNESANIGFETSISTLKSVSDKWVHTLWTYDSSLLLKTIEWGKVKGVIVRELKTLKCYNETINSILKEMMDVNFAMSADFARSLILNEEGGLYFDRD